MNNFIPNKYIQARSVYSAMGKVNARPTARVSKKEIIWEPPTSGQDTDVYGGFANGKDAPALGSAQGRASIVTRGREGADDLLANVKDSTVIFGGLPDPDSGTTFYNNPTTRKAAQVLHNLGKIEKGPGEKYDKLRGNMGVDTYNLLKQQDDIVAKAPNLILADAAERQKNIRSIMEGNYDSDGLLTARFGKSCFLPGFANGNDSSKQDDIFKYQAPQLYRTSPWESAVPFVTGSLMSLGQMLEANREPIYAPNTYTRNPYLSDSLLRLRGLRINPYPIMNRIDQNRRLSSYALRNNGGLSTGQKMASRVASEIGMNNSIAQALSSILQANNSYQSEAAKAAIAGGLEEAKNMQLAAQLRNEMYNKGLASRRQGRQTGQANLLNQLQQYQANTIKGKMYNSMMNLYDQKNRADYARIWADYQDRQPLNIPQEPKYQLNVQTGQWPVLPLFNRSTPSWIWGLFANKNSN